MGRHRGAGEAGGPQKIYLLSHLHSLADDELRERLRGFLAYAQANHGMALAPSEAYEVHKTLAGNAAPQQAAATS